jgi:predicted nucleotidyltransferase
MHSGVSSDHPPSAFDAGSHVDDFALTPAERLLLEALQRRGVRFVIVGMGAAVLEGAPLATQDLDLWIEQVGDERVRLAAEDVGGFWISGFGMQPPAFGGEGLERIDIVLTVHGLEGFATEYQRCVEREVDGLRLRVLPLERVIASKQALKRAKDIAQLPALEATLLARKG